MVSPVTGTIQQVYFRPGEMVPAGRPVVCDRAAGQSEGALLRSRDGAAAYRYGDRLCRCAATAAPTGLTAKVSFIAKTAEYTPPVIYSLEERNKLVFLIEALPEQPDKLRVGQPIDVFLPSDAEVSEAKK